MNQGPASRFDASYFARFYESPRSRVYGAEQLGHLARATTAMITWLGGELRTVLDVGAGVGLWREWFASNLPRVRYRSTDASAYACSRYGHERRNLATWRARDKFDFIICQGVLPYLSDEDCAAALANMAAMSRGFLYLEAITAHDLSETCDLNRTDGAVHAREGAWYRLELARNFVPLGLGMHYVKTGPLRFYELERG